MAATKSQVRFDFEVLDNDTSLAQKKERKERLNRLVSLLDHQEDLLLRNNTENGDEEGDDKREIDRGGGSRPGTALGGHHNPRSATPTSKSTRRPSDAPSPSSPLTRKPSDHSSPGTTRKLSDPVPISSLPRKASFDSSRPTSSAHSKNGPSVSLPQIKPAKTESTTPTRSNSSNSDFAPKSGTKTLDSASRSSSRTNTGRPRAMSSGHLDTIKRLHQNLMEMEKEKQEKIDFIIDSQDSAHESLRAAHLVGGLEDEKALKSTRRHSSLSQKDQLRLAQLLNS
eukprot:Phypoly_transcript_12415.p1 GENE.Phypoly_transcript_12415~~Phypoly_transcript_12415.p1  ORF type:complete len:303 (+),score=82.27 Phypoly_transcript_12415:63-911(+)